MPPILICSKFSSGAASPIVLVPFTLRTHAAFIECHSGLKIHSKEFPHLQGARARGACFSAAFDSGSRGRDQRAACSSNPAHLTPVLQLVRISRVSLCVSCCAPPPMIRSRVDRPNFISCVIHSRAEGDEQRRSVAGAHTVVAAVQFKCAPGGRQLPLPLRGSARVALQFCAGRDGLLGPLAVPQRPHDPI